MESLRDRLLRKREIDPETDCWIFTGALTKGGYGKIWVKGKFLSPHRLSYEMFVGPIPEGLHMDHFKCQNRRCFNPLHVRPVTPRENALRSDSPTALNAAKTKCPEGHEYDFITAQGTRGCHICYAATARIRRANLKREKK